MLSKEEDSTNIYQENALISLCKKIPHSWLLGHTASTLCTYDKGNMNTNDDKMIHAKHLFSAGMAYVQRKFQAIWEKPLAVDGSLRSSQA
jgi:hypothetical protein